MRQRERDNTIAHLVDILFLHVKFEYNLSMHWEIKKNCATYFIVMFAVLRLSGTEPVESSRCACFRNVGRILHI